MLNCDAAFDGDFASFATVAAPVNATMTGTAQLEPAGTEAGAYLVIPSTDSATINIRTLLGGSQQEATTQPIAIAPGGNTCNSPAACTFNQNGQAFVSLQTTMPYDAIEVSIDLAGPNAIEVHEFCVH